VDVNLQVWEFLQKEKENMLCDLEQLIGFKSYSQDRECCNKALQYVLDRAKSFGLETEMGKHGDVGVIDYGKGAPVVGVLVHVDVVDEGTLGLWNTDPFQLSIIDNVLYGRGVVDDKGPVISCLYAMKWLKESGIEPKKKVRMIVGTSEEIQWTDMEHYRAEFDCPAYGFTPDGLFPIYNRENGYMDIRLRFYEPALNGREHIKGGKAPNSIPSHASYEWHGALVEYVGKAAHSSGPYLGINAINLLCTETKEFQNLNFVQMINRYFPEGKYESAIPFHKTDGTEACGDDLILVPTVLWQEEQWIMINMNVRHSYLLPGDTILQALEGLSEVYHYEVIPFERLDPINVDESQNWMRLMKSITKEYGMDDQCKFAPGCSYAKSMPNFVCWGPVVKGDPTCAHMENERQPLDSFLLSAEMYSVYLTKEVQL